MECGPPVAARWPRVRGSALQAPGPLLRWGGAEAQRVEEERVARRKAARLEVEKLIADRELSGITAMAAAAVAATEEANEAETLDRLSAAQESARPLSRAFRQNSTREEATMRSLRQVLEGTQQVVSKWCTG